MSVPPQVCLILAPLSLIPVARAQPANDNLPPAPAAPPLVSVAPALAAEPEVSLEELIQLALRNNPQLPLARANLEAARERAAGARTLLNPTIQAVPRIVGDRTAADTEIIVSQPLDLFGRRRALSKVFAANVRGAQAQNTLAERGLVVAVKNAVADLFAAQEAENLGATQVEVAQLFRAAAARRAAVGDVPAVQVQRAALELARVQNELSAARAERLARRAALNQLVGRAPQAPLRVALPIAADFSSSLRIPAVSLPPNASDLPPIGADVLAAGGSLAGNVPRMALPAAPISPAPTATRTTGALDGSALPASSQIGADLIAQRAALLPGALARPDIVGAQATLEARQAQVNAISRQRLPEVELQVRRGSFFDGASGTALRAVITLPIFDFGGIGREKKAAQAEVRAGQAQLELLRAQATTQVEQALIRLQQQRQTVENYRLEIVPQTLDLLRKTQIGYAAGASTYLEVLDAQRTLRAVQTEYLQALVGTRTGEAALESALGAAPPAALFGPILNPTGAAAPPGTAPPGAVPDGTFPPNVVPPLDPPNSDLPANGVAQDANTGAQNSP